MNNQILQHHLIQNYKLNLSTLIKKLKKNLKIIHLSLVKELLVYFVYRLHRIQKGRRKKIIIKTKN
jgi:hypothetical protein